MENCRFLFVTDLELADSRINSCKSIEVTLKYILNPEVEVSDYYIEN